MGEVIEFVKSQNITITKIRKELEEFDKLNIGTKAALAEKLTAERVVYNEAIEIMANEVYDTGIENIALKEMIDVDQKNLDKRINQLKVAHSNDDRRTFILERLGKQENKLRALK